jgi:hypothetical protein
MNGPYPTQACRSGRQSLLGLTLSSLGRTSLLEAVRACSAIAHRHRTTILGGEQWKTGGLHELLGKTWMDKQRHRPQGPTGTRGSWLSRSNAHGRQTEQGRVVCGHMVGTRLVARDGDCKKQLRAGSLLQERPAAAHSENTRIRPSAGGYWNGIAPPHGVESPSPTPSDGVMRTRLCTIPTPPAGDYLDIAICIGGRI